MELAQKLAWAALALIHLAPASVLVYPAGLRALYGIEPGDDLGVLMRHRGALFSALVVLCVWAVFDPPCRPAASVAVTVSVVGFLVLYGQAGFPSGPLRRIALVDGVGLVPLGFVWYGSWVGLV